MDNGLEFVRKLYNGRSCYSDPLTKNEIELIHIPSGIEELLKKFINEKRIVFLTGNPGDGKTFLIKNLDNNIDDSYIIPDLNSERDLNEVVRVIQKAQLERKACIIAVNEYPLLQLLKHLKESAYDIYKEVLEQRSNSLVYDKEGFRKNGNIVVIDLNNRNLLDKDSEMANRILNKIISLIIPFANNNKNLEYNINALSNEFIKTQFLHLFDLIGVTGNHFVTRDILGTMSFILTAVLNDDSDEKLMYYDAVFEGKNNLFDSLRIFDPAFLSVPKIDEDLWNGELDDGWIIEKPKEIPALAEEESAYNIFRKIKRRFFFENKNAKDLLGLIPKEYKLYNSIFSTFGIKQERVKRDIVEGINKFFDNNDNNRDKLRIWTSLKYDQSQENKSAVSWKYVDASKLEIKIPELPAWLNGMEYTPNHFILRTKGNEKAEIEISIDFLRALEAVKDGYPVALIPTEYEYKIKNFMIKLESINVHDSYDDEVYLVNRQKGYSKCIYIKEETQTYIFNRGND